MAFSAQVISTAWENAHGHCEKCGKQLSWGNRGRDGRGSWEAHHKTAVSSGGSDVLSNCKILCFDCHKETRTFGR